LEGSRRELLEQRVATLAGAAIYDLLQHSGESLTNAGNFGDFAFRIAQDVSDALRIAFDGRRAVAVTADAKRVLACDLHQVGGLREYSRNLSVLHGRVKDDFNRQSAPSRGSEVRRGRSRFESNDHTHL